MSPSGPAEGGEGYPDRRIWVLLTLRPALDQPSPGSEICLSGGWGGGNGRPQWTGQFCRSRTTRLSLPRATQPPGPEVVGYPSAGPQGRPGGVSGSQESMGLPWVVQAVRSRYPQNFPGPSALSRLCKRLTQGVPACLGRNDCASGSEGDKCDLAAELRGSRAKCVMWEHSFCPEPASRGPEDTVSWGLFPREGGEGGSSGSAGRPGRHHPPSCWPWAPAGRTAFPVAGPALIRQSALASSVGNGYASSGAGGPAAPTRCTSSSWAPQCSLEQVTCVPLPAAGH